MLCECTPSTLHCVVHQLTPSVHLLCLSERGEASGVASCLEGSSSMGFLGPPSTASPEDMVHHIRQQHKLHNNSLLDIYCTGKTQVRIAYRPQFCSRNWYESRLSQSCSTRTCMKNWQLLNTQGERPIATKQQLPHLQFHAYAKQNNCSCTYQIDLPETRRTRDCHPAFPRIGPGMHFLVSQKKHDSQFATSRLCSALLVLVLSLRPWRPSDCGLQTRMQQEPTDLLCPWRPSDCGLQTRMQLETPYLPPALEVNWLRPPGLDAAGNALSPPALEINWLRPPPRTLAAGLASHCMPPQTLAAGGVPPPAPAATLSLPYKLPPPPAFSSDQLAWSCTRLLQLPCAISKFSRQISLFWDSTAWRITTHHGLRWLQLPLRHNIVLQPELAGTSRNDQTAFYMHLQPAPSVVNVIISR